MKHLITRAIANRKFSVIIALSVSFSALLSGCAYQSYEGSEHIMRYDPPKIVTAINSEYSVELTEITPTIGTVLVKFYGHERKTSERGEKLYDRFNQKSQWRLDDVELLHDGPADGLPLVFDAMDDKLIVEDAETTCNELGQALIRVKPATGYAFPTDSDQGLDRFIKDAIPVQARLKVVFTRSEGTSLEGEKFAYRDSTYFKIDMIDVEAGIADFMHQMMLKPYTIHVKDLESGEPVTKGEINLKIKSDPQRMLMTQFKEEGYEAAKAAFPFEQTLEIDENGKATFSILRNSSYDIKIDASRYPEFQATIDKFTGDKTVELYRGKGEMSSRIR